MFNLSFHSRGHQKKKNCKKSYNKTYQEAFTHARSDIIRRQIHIHSQKQKNLFCCALINKVKCVSTENVIVLYIVTVVLVAK